MPGETTTAAIPPELQDRLRQTAGAGGESVDEIVSSALSLYLELPQAARRTARMVQESGVQEATDALRRESVRAVAIAGDEALRAKLIAHGRELGIQDTTLSEEDLMAEAVEAVKAERRERREREANASKGAATLVRNPATGRYTGSNPQPGAQRRNRLPSG